MAVIVCILDAQAMGHPANLIIHPAQDLDVMGSNMFLSHFSRTSDIIKT